MCRCDQPTDLGDLGAFSGRGIFRTPVDGLDRFGHEGYWGVWMHHYPDLDLTVTGAHTGVPIDPSARRDLLEAPVRHRELPVMTSSELHRRVAPPPIASSILEVVGNTPLVDLGRAVGTAGVEGRILAKLEHLQPGLSKKSRVALEMVADARSAGVLVDGQTVVELTSGNTGTGLAIACTALGHPFVAVMSRGNTIERARMMAALGAEVVLVDQAEGSVHGEVSGADLDLVEQRARDIVDERRAFRADQFTLAASALAHERWTAEEIWLQTEGRLDVFVDFVGSGGSYGGVMRGLLRHDPDGSGVRRGTAGRRSPR